MKETDSLFKNYQFVALLVSQVLSQISINILSFLILIHIFERTGSSIATSLLWIAYSIPAIIFGPLAAAWVDMMEKRRVLMIVNLLQGIVVLGFAILVYRNVVFLPYVIVFLYSFLNQFYVPAEAATIPLIVKGKNLPAANSMFFMTQQSSIVLGFGVAGVLKEIFGFRPTLFVVSLCLFIGFVSVSFLTSKKPSTKLPEQFEKRVVKFFAQITEGYHFIRNNKKVLVPFMILLGTQVILTVIVTNLPRIATDIVMVPVSNSSLFVVLPAGLGAVIATLLISRFLVGITNIRKVILTSLIVFASSIVIISLIVPIINVYSVRILVAFLLFIVVGMSAVGTLIPSITYLQAETPKALLGRVFGNFWFLTTIATVVPVLFSATITDLFGIRYLVLFLGLICYVAFFLAGRKLKGIE